MVNFVKRIGADDAPKVLEFYLRHPNSFYREKMHMIGFALSDAEKLYAEWKTNRFQTKTDARHAEQKAHTLSQMQRIEEGLV